MASSGRPPPPKPWERAGAQAGSSPFAPSSPADTTAAAISSSPAANANDKSADPVRTLPVTDGADGRPMPLRPWEQRQNTGGYGTTSYGTSMTGYNRPYNSYGGFNSYAGYNSGYNSGSYGGGMYGGGMYGNSSYGFGGGGMYGNRVGGYGAGYGMPMGAPMGFGAGNPMNPNNPDDPYGGPPRPPGFWQSMLRVLHGVMTFFGRLAILIDENTQAFHFFMTALLQLCDRTGSLYGELARFVLRILGFRPRSSKGGRSLAIAKGSEAKQGEGAWDNVWTNGQP